VGTGALRHFHGINVATEAIQVDTKPQPPIITRTKPALNTRDNRVTEIEKQADKIAAAAPPELAQGLEQQAQEAQPGDQSMMAFDAAAPEAVTTANKVSGVLRQADSDQLTPAYHDQGRDRFRTSPQIR